MINYSQYYNKPAGAVPKNIPLRPPASSAASARKQNLPGSSEEGISMEMPGTLPAAPGLDDSPIYSGEIGRDDIILSLDGENILKGIIFSEILAKPKSKRTGR